MSRPQRITPGPGQESVWDYPRPPRLEAVGEPLRVEYLATALAAAPGGWRILETSHPPVYYIAPEAIRMELLRVNERRSFCEFKGEARYWDLVDGETLVRDVAWSYPQPSRKYAPLAHHLAFYASKVTACFVGDERVAPQAGDFYGGWITSRVTGPFKGAPGTWGW